MQNHAGRERDVIPSSPFSYRQVTRQVIWSVEHAPRVLTLPMVQPPAPIAKAYIVDTTTRPSYVTYGRAEGKALASQVSIPLLAYRLYYQV